MNQELESWVGDVKYKEFWITDPSKSEGLLNGISYVYYKKSDIITAKTNGTKLTHLIEYKAYQSAQSEIERLKKELEELKTPTPIVFYGDSNDLRINCTARIPTRPPKQHKEEK